MNNMKITIERMLIKDVPMIYNMPLLETNNFISAGCT